MIFLVMCFCLNDNIKTHPQSPFELQIINIVALLGAGSSGVTSQTAKRILEALESMSSPLIVSISIC